MTVEDEVIYLMYYHLRRTEMAKDPAVAKSLDFRSLPGASSLRP